MTLPTGSRLGPYEILSPVGAGGMGEVYRARDSRLGRDVAIKVLPEESHSDPERLRRFEQEAKAAGALNHPNLLAVYDVGTHNGAPYIVSELLEGETLRERLRPGELSPRKALEMAIAIAHGLSAAHAKGVVHRDLKPGNVFVTKDGQVKILDFGLAKLTKLDDVVPEGETASQATAPGSVIGTAGYMSPEQIRGHPADHRSDIFSLGVVLHEMVSGARPFRGETNADVMTAILREDPPELSASGAKPPPGLERIVRRCLEKGPEERFHSAHDLALALEAVSTGPEPTGRFASSDQRAKATVAVLPFVNLSADPDNEYFADGITEDVIAQLSRIQSLKVISRASVMGFKNRERSLREIGLQLGVATLVEGSVRRAGARVRIVTQLVDATTRQNLWAETYDRELTDIFAIQSDVALRIASALEAELSPDERARLGFRATPAGSPKLEAHEAYLRGRFHWYQHTPAALETALTYFELALHKDPEYALAHGAIADTWGGRTFIGVVAPRDAYPKVKAGVLKAMALDDSIAETHDLMGRLRSWYEWDWDAAESAFRRSIELNTNYADGRAFYARFLSSMGRSVEAKTQIDRALELDPLNALWQWIDAVGFFFQHRYDEAITTFRRAFQLDPSLLITHSGLWSSFRQINRSEEALAEAGRYFEAMGDREVADALTQGFAAGGYAGAMRSAAHTLAARSTQTYVAPAQVARLYAHACERDVALEWLEKAFVARDFEMVYLDVDPAWEDLRPDPRFQDLLRCMEFPTRAGPE